MNRVYANLMAFGVMFGVCFIALLGIKSFAPLLGAFLSWSSPSINWPLFWLFIRLDTLFSIVIGLRFVSGEAGQLVVDDIVSEMKGKDNGKDKTDW